MDATGGYRLEVPAVAAYLYHLRLFAAAVARRNGIVDDVWLADLKLLISEAASFALGDERHTLTLDVAVTATGFDYRLSPVSSFTTSNDVPDPYDIIHGLADTVRHRESDLVLSVSRPA